VIELPMLILAFLVLLVFGVPIAFAILVPSLLYFVVNDLPLTAALSRMAGTLNSFTIMAVPFFVLAGQIMNRCGLTERLVGFSLALVGHLRGGLAQVNVMASLIFSGMSGSAVADAGGLGSVLIPAMEKDGYRRSFASALTAASCTIGPLVPPSIPMVIYGVIAEVSIGRLFLAGAFPGFLLAALMMVMLRFMPATAAVPRYPRATLRQIGQRSSAGVLALLMPVIILGGIIFGIFTPTEAAAAATIYGIVVGILILRTMKLEGLRQALLEGMLISGGVLFIVAAAGVLAWIIAREGLLIDLVLIVEAWNLTPLQLLLIISLLLLVVGMVIEPLSILVVLTPLLHPLTMQLGIDPVHFGVVMVFNLMIGLVTPPMGLALYVVSDISRLPVERIVRDVMPFYLPMLAALLIVILFPELVLFLPNLVFG
jgi:tripartite ATP-independent transporter DctM subunit